MKISLFTVLGLSWLVFNGCSVVGAVDSGKGMEIRGDDRRFSFGNLDSLLAVNGMTKEQFVELSTDSAWSVPAGKWVWLKQLRESIEVPNSETLLQKVIPVDDVQMYVSGRYQIGGFVSVAGDVDTLHTMHDVYWGLRLDYTGTRFSENGGYAVIRFRTESADALTIPYFTIKNDSLLTQWPNGGGGFSTSELGGGGFPEWTFGRKRIVPKPGAELLEFDSMGVELKRYEFADGEWRKLENAAD